MKIISVVGARPNFMKIAPFIRAIEEHNKNSGHPVIEHVLVHTGQHYDDRMSKAFFDALDIPAADINLGIGSGSHAEQVGKTMIEFEQTLLQERPDWVVVVGDVNATLACSVTAKKLHIKVCHIEAGLRSRDERMPEEINRLVTDSISDLLLTPDEIALTNLKQEGVQEHKISFVGNIMIDTLEANRHKASKLNIKSIIEKNQITGQESPNSIVKDYGLMTLHRPSNVDHQTTLEPIISLLKNDLTTVFPIIWPIHPRSQGKLKEFGLWETLVNYKNLILLHPIGYHEMLRLNMDAKIMLTDSGGLQEECCVLGTPCLTLRWNTERPITLREHGGASVLVGNDIEQIKAAFHTFQEEDRQPVSPKKWDGLTASRCLQAILRY